MENGCINYFKSITNTSSFPELTTVSLLATINLLMKRSYFLKKKISDVSKSFGLFLVKNLYRFYKLVFTKRTVLFVTNEKIRSITLGPVLQGCTFLFIAWVGNLFIQSLRYDEVISAKSEEISKLKSVNSYFEEEFTNVNDKLKKINEYLISVTGSVHNVKASEQNFKQPKNLKEEELSKRDKHTLNEIKDASNQLASIQAVAQTRIKKIENAIAVTGLNIKKMPTQAALHKKLSTAKEVALNGKKSLPQGGPLDEDQSLESALASSTISDEDYLERHLEKIKFTGEIDYLMVLERLAQVMPLSKPMKNYYISSGFGARSDPITHRTATHQGLDFVGVTHEKIVSPSHGRVIMAGQFSDYGNAVVIDHGFGITTRYGHLSQVKVKAGQVVSKGDVIALQGSTGRSTGQHLHYEVRYRNVPLNPRKFLEAGETLFNNEKAPKYATS